MSTIRLATYNVEWMNNLFVPGETTIRTAPGRAMGRNPKDPRAVAQRIAAVIRDTDADIVGIQEGPSLLAQMNAFVKSFLGGDYRVFGVQSGSQSLYALVRRGLPLKVTQVPPDAPFYRHLGNPVVFQPWGEYTSTKTYRMARPPVLLKVVPAGSDEVVHLIVAHTKSQFTQGFTARKFRERDPAAMKAALLSRQRLSADIAAYRRHVTHVIKSRSAAGVVLMGDLNDGFARSTFEREYLLQSLVDELRGSFRRQSALLEHVMTEEQLGARTAYTVSFDDPERDGRTTRELIDHILVTPGISGRRLWLRLRRGSARIGHDVSAAHTVDGGRRGDDRPSDHVPVWADFDVA